jgi:HTH-type transcriptional regulator / antitoxin HipB
MKKISINSIGQVVRATRIAQRFRAADVASMCGVSESFISDLENGKSTLQIGKVLHVLDELGIVLELKSSHLNQIDFIHTNPRKRMRS